MNDTMLRQNPISFQKHQEMERYAATLMLDCIRRAPHQHDRKVCIGLSSGFSYTPIYRIVHDTVLKEKLPLDNVIFFLVDDRFVHSDQPESNPQKYILKDLPNATMLYPKVDTLQLKECVEQYDNEIKKMLEENIFIDLITLKFESDGHCAGLFGPARDELIDQCSEHVVFHCRQSRFQVPDRITVGLPFLQNRAESLLLMVKGEENISAFSDLEDQIKLLPSSTTLPADLVRKFPVSKLLKQSNVTVLLENSHNKQSQA